MYCKSVHDPVLYICVLSGACCPCTRLGHWHVTQRTFTWLSTLLPPEKAYQGRSVGERKCCPTHFLDGNLMYKDIVINSNRTGNSPDVTCFRLEPKGQDFIEIPVPILPSQISNLHVSKLK